MSEAVGGRQTFQRRRLQIDLRASGVGAQVPFDFWRQRSLSDARIETTMLRVSGVSDDCVVNELPSARAAASGCTSEMAVPRSAAAVLSGAARTDMATVC